MSGQAIKVGNLVPLVTGTQSGAKTALDVNVVDPVVVPSTFTVENGRKTVAAAGTAEALAASSTFFKTLTVQALRNNTGDIAIGGSGVIEAPGTEEGNILFTTQSYHFAEPGDLADIFIDVATNGEGVSFIYTT